MAQELKAHIAPTPDGTGLADYYLKSEADKVIADKEAEIARLKAIRKVHVKAIGAMGAGLQQDEEKIRHHKYKRCLAMAKWCECRWADIATQYYKSVWYRKWHKRWLELAEKFKEAK